jgi:uncharacterized protein (TIGR00725 family)
MQISSGTELLLRDIACNQSGAKRIAQPLGFIGPSDGGDRECSAAYWLANHLAGVGLTIVCGGRAGVMEAAAKGAAHVGGTVIGLLPGDSTSEANPYLTVALPTGMGEMRNALIARASIGLIAVGGGLGTISEKALGLKLGKPVFALYEDVKLEGQLTYLNAPDLLHDVAQWLSKAMALRAFSRDALATQDF